VGRFLEHSRIYYFHNGGGPQIYLGSADLMRRNLDRRVEVLFPIENPALKSMLRHQVLDIYLKDTKDATMLLPDGNYVRVQPVEGEAPFSAQEWFLSQRPSTPSL
jgi:polyphosphate kinase